MEDVFGLVDGVAYFTGSNTTAGIFIYIAVLLLLLACMRNVQGRFFYVAIPVTLAMGVLGILQSNTLYLMLFLCIAGALTQYRRLH